MDSDNTGLSDVIDELESELDTLITRLEALEAEHEAAKPIAKYLRMLATKGASVESEDYFVARHDNAERVMKP